MAIYNNVKERDGFEQFEREIQAQLDEFYFSRGCRVERKPKVEYDVILNGVTVEEKIRDGIYSDILVEFIQDVVRFTRGWFYTTGAKKLNYVMCASGRIVYIYHIQCREFKKWVTDVYLPQYHQGKYVASPRGCGLTLNIAVPIDKIPDDLIREIYE